MRKLLVFFSMMVVAAAMSFNLTSCGSDDPDPLAKPTVQILVDVDEADGYKVNITVQATDAATYSWDYGDGETSTTSGNHSYTYAASGSYTIAVTVDNGEGLTASASETKSIVASIEEIIAGAGDGGKTWVLTQNEASFAGKIGGGPVDNSMAIAPDMSLIPSGVMEMFGLGGEYNDEYTFYNDGTLEINTQNGLALGGILYGSITELIQVPSADPGSLPLCAMTYANVDATWSLGYEDLVVPCYNEFTSEAFEDITFTFAEDDATKVAEMKLSQGAFLGFADLDYTGVDGVDVDNSFYILKEVTPEAMHFAIGIAGMSDVSGVPAFMLPSFMLHLTLVPKQ